jgi:RND family efflux transporter MFP subunit
MFARIFRTASARPATTATSGSLFALLTVAAAWLLAHESHEALPSRGAAVNLDTGRILLSAEARAALGVATEEVRQERFDESVMAPAKIVPTWQGHAYVATQLAGKIAAVNVQPGQTITRGQAVAQLQSLELENLYLEWENADNEARLATENVKQLEAAFTSGSVSPQTMMEERARLQERRNALEIARRKLASLGVKVDASRGRPSRPALTVPIKSPIAGVVIHADVRIGQVVEPAQHLFEVVDLSTVRVQANVLEKDLHRIETGQTLELGLTAYPGRADHFQGKVQGVGLALDPKTRAGAVWAEMVNPSEQRPRLLPGMFGQARILHTVAGKALTVPAAALVSDGAERYVFLEEGPGQYARKNVIVLDQKQKRVRIAPGSLTPGDSVVTSGSHELATFFDQHELRPSPEAARRIDLRVEQARRRSVAEVVTIDGAIDLAPDRRAIASTRLPGVVQSIRIDRDQEVRAGNVIAEVASLELQSLQLDLYRSQLQLQVLKQALDRLRALNEAGNAGVSARQVRETESLHTLEEQRRDSLKRRLLQAGLSEAHVQLVLEKGQFASTLPVRAPISGHAVRFLGVLGQAVKADDPLFEIHDLSGIWVQGHVPERELARVRLDQPARVTLAADPNFTADAVVRRSARVFDAEDRTLSIWAQLGSAPKRPLPVGMLARLNLIVSEPAPTLAVPLDAIWRDGSGTYLFVKRPGGVFERRPVRTGRSDDRFIEINNGLDAGEVVATHAVPELQTAYSALK